MVELINDNCSNIILNIIERCKFPIIVTDPPFNIGYKYNNYKDNMPEQEYYNWLADIFKLCPSVIIHYPEDIKYGEVFDAKIKVNKEKIVVDVENENVHSTHYYETFAEFNEEWKDYKEPKGNWTIDPMNEDYIDDGKYTAPDELERYEEVGLKFNTEEEAKKAVEKLKALKRLRENGFKFKGWYGNTGEYSAVVIYADVDNLEEDTRADLDLLFGGEE